MDEFQECAYKVLTAQKYEELINSYDNNDFSKMEKIVSEAYDYANSTLINSILNNECDFVIIDHFRKAYEMNIKFINILHENVKK